MHSASREVKEGLLLSLHTAQQDYARRCVSFCCDGVEYWLYSHIQSW